MNVTTIVLKIIAIHFVVVIFEFSSFIIVFMSGLVYLIIYIDLINKCGYMEGDLYERAATIGYNDRC